MKKKTPLHLPSLLWFRSVWEHADTKPTQMDFYKEVHKEQTLQNSDNF